LYDKHVTIVRYTAIYRITLLHIFVVIKSKMLAKTPPEFAI